LLEFGVRVLFTGADVVGAGPLALAEFDLQRRNFALLAGGGAAGCGASGRGRLLSVSLLAALRVFKLVVVVVTDHVGLLARGGGGARAARRTAGADVGHFLFGGRFAGFGDRCGKLSPFGRHKHHQFRHGHLDKRNQFGITARNSSLTSESNCDACTGKFPNPILPSKNDYLWVLFLKQGSHVLLEEFVVVERLVFRVVVVDGHIGQAERGANFFDARHSRVATAGRWSSLR